jgi:excisionase family DNA binding protein
VTATCIKNYDLGLLRSKDCGLSTVREIIANMFLDSINWRPTTVSKSRRSNLQQRRWFTIAEAGEYFQLPKGTLYSLANRGRLPDGAVLRLGRQLRIDIRAIEEERKNLASSSSKLNYGGKE